MRCILLILATLTAFADTTAVYLSWQDDPTTTMSVHWHTPAYDPRFDAHDSSEGALYFATNDTVWQKESASSSQVENTLIHTVHLSDLSPNTLYSFSIEGDPTVYRFRTAPASLDRSVSFLVGGDVYSSTKIFRRMSKTAISHNPLFAVLGSSPSQTASLHPFKSSMKRWTCFLKDWQKNMVNEEGCILPFLPVASTENNELLFALFNISSETLYRTVHFGSYLSLLLLDSGHPHAIEGEQTHWLEHTLNTLTTPHRFAFYHESAYPSTHPKNATLSNQILSHWAPLFEKHRLTAVFEHNSDAFKRTHPLKAGQIDPSGITYIGDGGWGSIPRKAHAPWYLASRSHKNVLLLVHLGPNGAHFEAVDLQNRPLDFTSFK